MSIKEANKVVHSVESQWHYKILTSHGYIADTKEAIGLVRAYDYTHPMTKHQLYVATGYNGDYWIDEANKTRGYWASLEPHLLKL